MIVRGEGETVRVLIREMERDENGKLTGKDTQSKHITVHGKKFEEIVKEVLEACK